MAVKKKAKSRRRVGGNKSPARAGGALAAFCRGLPGTTEDVKWGADLVFSIGGKMYAAFSLDDSSQYGFKATEEEFWRLIQREGIIPAPYAARFHWVAVRKRGALPAAEARRRLRESYEIVLGCLPRRKREQALGGSPTSTATRRR